MKKHFFLLMSFVLLGALLHAPGVARAEATIPMIPNATALNTQINTSMNNCANYPFTGCAVRLAEIARGSSMVCPGIPGYGPVSGPATCMQVVRYKADEPLPVNYDATFIPYTCPAPWEPTTDKRCACPGVTTCPLPPDTCAQNQKRTFMPTTGWGWITGMNNGSAVVKGAPGRMSGDGNTPPTTLCEGNCQYVADGAVSDFLVAKQASATGMHRISVQQDYISTGGSCSGTSPDIDQSIVPSCPGALGTLDGKPACIATDGSASTDLGGRTVGEGTSSMANGTKSTATNPDGTPAKMPGSAGSTGTGAPGSGATASTGAGTSSLPAGTSTVEGTNTTKYGPVTNSTMGGVPVLYERKYAKSPVEHWTASTGVIKTKMGEMSAVFAPSWPETGVVPSFSLHLSMGQWDFGEQPINIPSAVWVCCKAVILISALLLARALIFGG